MAFKKDVQNANPNVRKGTETSEANSVTSVYIAANNLRIKEGKSEYVRNCLRNISGNVRPSNNWLINIRRVKNGYVSN